MQISAENKKIALKQYIEEVDKGIRQHSDEWHAVKQYTIGGSQMATIQGVNAFETIETLIAGKIGYSKSSTIHMNWGNLFEDILKAYVERVFDTEIIGDNIFIHPNNGLVSYSPDGLGVVGSSTVLFEFKCMYSRLPRNTPPKYYIPQVKTGLDIIPVADYGMLIEAVFRRCRWAQMGLNDNFDTTLVAKKMGCDVLACGLVGFYCDLTAIESACSAALLCGDAVRYEKLSALLERIYMFNELYLEEYSNAGTTANKYATNDLGISSEKLFTLLLECFMAGGITAWYSDIIMEKNSDAACKNKLNVEFATYECIVAAVANANTIKEALSGPDSAGIDATDEVPARVVFNYGIMPWKLFHVKYHHIDKTPNYIEQWMPKIKEVISTVEKCAKMSPDARKRYHDSILTSQQYTIIE